MTTGLAQLRPYQAEAGRAIMRSVTERRGLTFTVEISRQGGKNELSAQVEAAILAAFSRSHFAGEPVSIIKAAPTFDPQCRISMRRLVSALRAAHLTPATADGHIVSLGDASVDFLSAGPDANIVGHTATPLLEVDEAQDVDVDKYDKELRPFAASTNATTVLYGTPWLEFDLLGRERQAAQQAQRIDGVQRSFMYPWTTVAAHAPAYGAYVARERERLGATHPLFLTQYELQQLPGKGRLLTATQLAQLAGDYPRSPTPPAVGSRIAALDVAGGDDEGPGAHDRTVLTLGTVTPATAADPLPDNHAAVLHHVAWQGTPHDQLLPALLDLVRLWSPTSMTIDASGLGETTARMLAARNPRTTVTPIKFTRPSKSLLGFALTSAISTGRLKVYANDGSADATTFWSEAKLARADYLPGNIVNFYVDPSEGHDDYLISLALFAHAASVATPRIARGRV